LKAYVKRAGDGANEIAEQTLQVFGAVDSGLTGLMRSMGLDVDLSGDALAGKSPQAGKSGGSFIGSAIFNGLDEGDIEGAAAEFIKSWIDAVETEAGKTTSVGNIVRMFSGSSEEIIALIDGLSNIMGLAGPNVVTGARDEYAAANSG